MEAQLARGQWCGLVRGGGWLLHHVRHHVPHLGILNNRHKTFRGKNALQHMTTYKKKEVKSEASNGI